MNAQMSQQLELRWVPVLDDRGRTRMQASWVGADAAPQAASAAAGHAAHAA